MATRAENFAKMQKILEDNGVDINKYNAAKASGASSSDALKAGWYTGGSTTWTSSGGTTSSGGSSSSSSWLANKWDIYGDSSKNPTTKDPMDFSSYTGWGLDKKNAVFGDEAIERWKTEEGYLTTRNNQIAYDLYNNKKWEQGDVENYLNEFDSFVNARDEDKANTIRAITDRLQAIKEEEENKKRLGEDLNLQNLGDKEPGTEWRAWYYNTKDGLQKIYGYDEMDDETKNLVDRLDDSKKKYVSNLWAQWMQEDLKYYLDTMRAKDQASARQDINKELYDINRESSLIQAEQTIRNAEESYNNLKQNWQYLGNLWMPGVSSTKIQAIGDAITEAKTTLWEVKRLTQLSLDAQEKQWEGQVLQYNQQIDNLMYDLKWKVWDEITKALSKYTTAELEGKLDTIDGITAFRKELLDDLDNNLSGLTSASLNQMQWINQQYQDIANRMYEYSQNANKVNAEMSSVKGYYVDGNGNPILNNQGQPIQVPQNAPMEPVFDKETGKLITFGLDENGNIVASVQQVYQGDATNMQSTIVSLLEQGVSVQDILKYVPNADLKTVTELSKVVNQVYGEDGRSLLWDGWKYTAIDESALKSGYDNFLAKYTTKNDKWQRILKSKDIIGGQCWHFVNNYLQSLGITRLFTDPITEKTKNINSNEAKVGSVVIMNSPTSPEYGHVGIVTAVGNDWTLTILQSNKWWEEKVFVSKKNIDDKDVLGFFDPTKSIDQYNSERRGEAQWTDQSGALWGYRDGYVPDYTNFLKSGVKGFSNWQRDELTKIFGSWENFVANAEAYKTEIDHQVGEVAMTMVDNMVDILAWLNEEDNGIGDLRFAMPGTKAYEMKKKYNQVMKSSALQKLIDLKSDGATFGALSDNELWFITDAADWFSLWWTEQGLKDWMEEKIKKILSKSWMTTEQYLQRRGKWWTTWWGWENIGWGWINEEVDVTNFSRGSW